MVEKTKLPAGLKTKSNVESKRSPGGILKSSSSKSLNSVPEFGETQIQRTDSTLESEKPTTPNEEQRKFQTLCDGVQNTIALFQTSMAELLALKDELIKHSLPPSLLVKLTLVTSKLFRGSSDLSVPINELVRLVKLYSAPWETKSAALKKLHEDYENKQRQLNVALQKLVLVGIQSERMAQEKRVLNWERLFSRMMTSKAHGYRWKFLIESFKKKVKTGEVYEAGTSTDTEAEKEQDQRARKLESVRRKTIHKDTAAKRIMRESVSIQSARESLSTPITGVNTGRMNEEDKETALSDSDLDEILKDFEVDQEETTEQFESPNRQSRVSLSPRPPRPSPAKESPRPRIRFMAASDDEEEEEEAQTSVVKFMPRKKAANRPRFQFADEKPKPAVKKPIKSRGVRFFSPSSDEDDEEEAQEEPCKPAEPEKPKVAMEDKECWTHEPDYDRSLHLRIFRPVCKKAESPCCSVVFNDEVMKTDSYPPPEPPAEQEEQAPAETKPNKSAESKGSSKGTSKIGSGTKQSSKGGSTPVPPQKPPESIEPPPLRFEELVFKLPEDSSIAPGQTPVNLKETQIKISIHPAPNDPMIAMAAIKYGDIKLVDSFEGKWSHTEYAQHIQEFPLMSAVSDREMPFGTTCGSIPIVCYVSKTERPKILAKATGTPTFEELIQNEIEERRKIEEAERAAAMEGIPQPVYTEQEMDVVKSTHNQELQSIQEEYEKRLNELAQGLSAYSGDEEGLREFVHAATSPMFMRSPSPLRSPSGDQLYSPKPPQDASRSPGTRRARPKMANLPEWGKDLPEDFMVRLDMFQENSERYRQELEEKTKRAIQQKYELQMAVQNRLDRNQDDETPEDVCLPAVFMPTRTGIVYSPKAHSYFHPPGSSEGRLSQPPSVFKLPHLDAANHVSVLNLFDMGERVHTSGTQGLVAEQHFHQGVPHVPQTAPPPPTAFDIRSPPPYPGRSCTR